MVAESILQKTLFLSELVEPESFREVITSLADLYGIGIKVFDAGGTKIADVRIGQSSMCSMLFGYPGTRVACTKHVGHLKRDDLSEFQDKAMMSDCHTGLRYATIPLLYEGDILGRLILGPFWPKGHEEPNEELYRIEPTVPRSKVNETARQFRVASEGAIQKMLTQVRTVVDVLIYTSYRAMLTSSMHVESVTANYHEIIEKNRQLAAANERLKEVDRLKSSFLAVVSHELRTPLTSIIGYAEMLMEGMAGDLNAEQGEYVGTVMEKGETLLQMISSLLDISRIESGKVILNMSEVSIGGVLDAAISSVAPQVSKKQIQLTQKIADDVPVLRADHDKLRQVLVNLLGNAVKFTPAEGRIDLVVDRYFGARHGADDDAGSVFEQEEEDFVRLCITDSGIGIASDQQQKIFDSFYQVDSSSTREFGGTGLGLSIVKSFIEAHRGQIWVESRPGEGASFTILLPSSDEG